MKLVAGLGNPGREYEETRHNLGFMLIDRLAQRWNARRFRHDCEAHVAEATLGTERILLVKPQTYMNLSGNSIKPLLMKHSDGDPRQLTVVCDDVALPFGMLRIRAKGSAGGQKGLISIIERLGTQDFYRVRIGIKPDHPIRDLPSFVLARFSGSVREELDAILERAADAVETVVSSGVERAMQLSNEKVTSDE